MVVRTVVMGKVFLEGKTLDRDVDHNNKRESLAFSVSDVVERGGDRALEE